MIEEGLREALRSCGWRPAFHHGPRPLMADAPCALPVESPPHQLACAAFRAVSTGATGCSVVCAAASHRVPRRRPLHSALSRKYAIQPRRIGLRVSMIVRQDCGLAPGRNSSRTLVLQPGQALGRDPQARLPVRTSRCSRGTSAPTVVHRALGRVDRQPELLRQEPGERAPSPVRPARSTAHRCCSRRRSGRRHGRVVPVPGRGQSSRMFDSSGDSGPPCGVPSVRGVDHPVRHHPSFQIAADQPQHPLVADLASPLAPSARRG